jgi:hypothetical protein
MIAAPVYICVNAPFRMLIPGAFQRQARVKAFCPGDCRQAKKSSPGGNPF